MRKKQEPTVKAAKPKKVKGAPKLPAQILAHRVSCSDTIESIAAQYAAKPSAIISENVMQYPAIAAGIIEPGWTLSIKL